jgi:hypothetical protein
VSIWERHGRTGIWNRCRRRCWSRNCRDLKEHNWIRKVLRGRRAVGHSDKVGSIGRFDFCVAGKHARLHSVDHRSIGLFVLDFKDLQQGSAREFDKRASEIRPCWSQALDWKPPIPTWRPNHHQSHPQTRQGRHQSPIERSASRRAF